MLNLRSEEQNALIAIVDLVKNGTEKPVRISDIIDRQGGSKHVLEQIFRKLRNANVVVSVRGPGGGYKLSKDASEISLYDVIHAVNSQNKSKKNTKTLREQFLENGETNEKNVLITALESLSYQVEEKAKAITLESFSNACTSLLQNNSEVVNS